MSRTAEKTLFNAMEAFGFSGAEVCRYGQGHINDSFRVKTSCKGEHILQRLSPVAFSEPEKLMENIVSVTEFLKKKLEAEHIPGFCTIELVPTLSGGSFFRDEAGSIWRDFVFVENSSCYQRADSPEMLEEAGRAFGIFQRLLADYPANELHETIRHFHDTPDRLEKFKKALDEDAVGRAASVKEEAKFILRREDDCGVLEQARRDGAIPLRVTHNDTKLTNLLFDSDTGRAKCVIDLDTVMPGLAANDFGDAIRAGANHCDEDEKNIGRVSFDMELFCAYTRGYLSEAGDMLRPEEIRLLPWGARLMTLESGIRFLTDYLQGDVYFHTAYPEHNLVRCRSQLKLLSDMERLFPEMEKAVERSAYKR